MVFTNLPHHEKDAFFSLLDEYFQSRPELAAKLSSSSSAGSGHGGPDVHAAMGRVASAASAFSASRNFGGHDSSAASASGSSSPPPPTNPSRRIGAAGSNMLHKAQGLVSSQGFSDVDTSSKGAMLASTWKKPPAPKAPVVPPPAFGPKKSSFAPPPVRRAEPEPEPEPEPEGEWAEAQYDYDATEPTDLSLKERQRVLVTERTSADWWTGTVDGKSGLFPASYVKLL